MTNEEIETLKLVNEHHPLLKKKLAAFDFDQIDAKELAMRMFKIMLSCRGAGLSANQLGVDAQMFVMQWPDVDGDEAGTRTVINPEILEYLGEPVQFEEGCLSFPALFIWLKRPEAVRVRYQDLAGAWIEETMEGWRARIFQHEYDHLQGITFKEHASKLKLSRALEKRNKIFKRAGIDYNKVIND
jgi:peptide deformylase